MKDKNSNSSISNYVNIAAICLLAFFGAYFSLEGSGILRSFFILPLCCFIAAFIKLHCLMKAAFFVGFGLLLNSLYVGSLEEGIRLCIICGAEMAVFQTAVHFLRKKKVKYAAISLVLIMLTIPVQLHCFGNPISAVSAQSKLKDYIGSSYNTESFDISKVYYDIHEGCFALNINFKDVPVDIYRIYCNDSGIHDGFRQCVEKRLMEKERVAITEALRKAFPDGRFSVVSKAINGYSGCVADCFDITDYSSRMRFDIVIPADITDTEFSKRVIAYNNIILNIGSVPADITYFGGRGGKFFRYIPMIMTNLPQSTVPKYFVNDFLQSKLSALLDRP